MPWLQSASFAFAVPAGCAWDPPDHLGLANLVSEMVQRGAGDLDSRGLVEKLEMLGIDFSSHVSVYQSVFSGSLPAPNLFSALEVYSDILRRPLLPADQLEDARLGCLQEIRAIEDDLAQKVMLQVRARQFGQPWGRWCQGTLEGVLSSSMMDMEKFHSTYYQPGGLILAVAGHIVWDELVEAIERLFGDWDPHPGSVSEISPCQFGSLHLPFDSQQTHIGLGFASVPYADDDYFLARAAVGALSDGMSSRLFTEIREKRGLCYSVHASLQSLKDRGAVISYVGTGADRAQQSLDVLIEQLCGLQQGIHEEELQRLKVQIRSHLVMQQESSRARARSIAGDYFHLGRARSLQEVNQLVEGLTVPRINDYLSNHPIGELNLVTLGPDPLELKYANSAAPIG